MDLKQLEFDRHKNCRVCLQTYSEMCDIFGKVCEYDNMLRECGGVDIEVNDGLPVVICEYCVQEMKQAHHFLTKCRNADKKLRMSIIENTNQELVKVSSDIITSIDEKIIIKVDPDQHLTSENNVYDSFTPKSEYKNKHKYLQKKILRKKLKKSSSIGFPKKCANCSLILKCKSAMVIHMRCHTNERPFQCVHCGECFKTKGVLKAHMAVHRDKSEDHVLNSHHNFQCDHCRKFFRRKSDLVTHTRIHTGETPYSCKFCIRAFNQLSSLQRHIKVHTGEKPYTCNICHKPFSTSDAVRKHSSVHSSERKFSCSMCGVSLKTKVSLQSHIAVKHDNSKRVVCDQCGVPFNSPGYLKIHFKKVHSELSGRCEVCNKDYSNIKEHSRQHTGEMAYECNYCEKKFCTRNSLKMHTRKHNNLNKFPCEYENCTKSFPFKAMLVFHILKYHKKQTPYICKHCNRGFYRLSDLKRHLKLNHSDEPNILEDIKNLT